MKTPEDKVLEAVNRGEDRIFKTIQQDLRNHIVAATDPDDQMAEDIDYEVDEVMSRLSERIQDEIAFPSYERSAT